MCKKKMSPAVFIAILIAIISSTNSAQAAALDDTITGDWRGTLQAGAMKLRIVIKIAETDEGDLKASLDSPDQGATDIPATVKSYEEGQLHLTVPSIGGVYKGKLEGSTLKGTWSQMGQSMTLDLTTEAFKTQKADAETVKLAVGSWTGFITVENRKMSLMFTVEKASDGSLTGKMHSLDEGAVVPFETMLQDGKLLFKVNGVGGVYQGSPSEDQQQLDGQWQQSGMSFPMVLTRKATQ